MALISARWDGAIRAGALGRVTGAASVLSCLGPMLGGAVDAAGGWRWTLVLPVAGLLALPVLWRGIGQPAIILGVSGAVESEQRGVALGVTTLVFLAGAGVGAAVVGGLGEVLGLGGALSVLVLLPVAGTLVMLRFLPCLARYVRAE